MIVLQLCLYRLLFTAMVRYSVIGGAINGLYFYPKAVQERAYEIGLTDRETVKLKYKRFMTSFYIVMLAALILIIDVWNRVSDFKTAYLQALLFLEVMNIYDGIYNIRPELNLGCEGRSIFRYEWEHKNNNTSWKQQIRDAIDDLIPSVRNPNEL